MLPFIVAAAIACMGLALALAAARVLPVTAAWHLAFAAGVMPLILAAMTHFVPVLTRSRGPGRAVTAIAPVALGAGLLAALAFARPELVPHGIRIAAAAALAAAGALLAWVLGRGRGALGAPHPGLAWYAAALACLVLALAAALALPHFAPAAPRLRLLHLHLNTLGFVGLTALGTLPVLLPTALGKPDPQAAARLARDGPPALAGVLLVAAGAAFHGALAAAGAALLLWATLGPLFAWGRRYRAALLRVDGAAPCLAAATCGLVAVLLLGLVHAAGFLPGTQLALGFIAAFLLPLVTGAASQLLPVWLRPGVQGPWHGAMRTGLTRFGGLRGAALVAAGIAAALGAPAGAWLALALVASFAVQAATVLWRGRRR